MFNFKESKLVFFEGGPKEPFVPKLQAVEKKVQAEKEKNEPGKGKDDIVDESKVQDKIKNIEDRIKASPVSPKYKEQIGNALSTLLSTREQDLNKVDTSKEESLKAVFTKTLASLDQFSQEPGIKDIYETVEPFFKNKDQIKPLINLETYNKDGDYWKTINANLATLGIKEDLIKGIQAQLGLTPDGKFDANTINAVSDMLGLGIKVKIGTETKLVGEKESVELQEAEKNKDQQKIEELIAEAELNLDYSKVQRKLEEQDGFRVGYILQGKSISGPADSVGLPSDVKQTIDTGDKVSIINIAKISEIDPEKGLRITLMSSADVDSKSQLEALGVKDGDWIKPAELKAIINKLNLNFSHCEEGNTRCITPKREGESVAFEAKAKALIEAANALNSKMDVIKVMRNTSISSKRAIASLGANIICKDGKLSFSPEFLTKFDSLSLDQKKSAIKQAQDTIVIAVAIEETEKTEDPLGKQFSLGNEALAAGDLGKARYIFTRFLKDSFSQNDKPEVQEMIKFAQEQVTEFNKASIQRLQKINDQLADTSRYLSVIKDPVNRGFLKKFVEQNKANLEIAIGQIKQGNAIDSGLLLQREEQTLSNTRVSAAAAYGGVDTGGPKDNTEILRNAWNSVVYAEFSTAAESDSSKVQDAYLTAARQLRELGQSDISSEYFEGAMKDDIERVSGTISEAQKEGMRAKVIKENEGKRGKYETEIRERMFKQIEKFNETQPKEKQRPLEISGEKFDKLVKEAMSEGVEEQMKSVVMKGMEAANDKGLLKGGAKEAWSEYDSMLDPNGKWFTISDKTVEKIVEQVVINSAVIILSGGVGSLVSGGLRAYMIANGITSGAALTSAEVLSGAAAATLANSAIRASVLGEKGMFMPKTLAKNFGMSLLLFGAFKGSSKLLEMYYHSGEAAAEIAGVGEVGAVEGEVAVAKALEKGGESLGKVETVVEKALEKGGEGLVKVEAEEGESMITEALEKTIHNLHETAEAVVEEAEKQELEGAGRLKMLAKAEHGKETPFKKTPGLPPHDGTHLTEVAATEE